MVFPNTIRGFGDCRSVFLRPKAALGSGVSPASSVCHTNAMLARGNVHFRDACADAAVGGAAAIRGIVDFIAPRGLLSKENQPHGIRSNRTKRRFADSVSGVVDYIVDYGTKNRRGRQSIVDYIVD